MTYIEKIMQAIKIDKEILTEDQRLRLTEGIEHIIRDRYCPADFLESVTEQECKGTNHCEDCWNREAK